jgi:hypothetical protein
MESWDQSKLEEAIAKKHGKDTSNLNKSTEIVCKHFLDAVENQKYGWFWECPNGGDKCKYRHALPPGFVLKKKETAEERREREEREKENAITIEDFLETEVRERDEQASQCFSSNYSLGSYRRFAPLATQSRRQNPHQPRNFHSLERAPETPSSRRREQEKERQGSRVQKPARRRQIYRLLFRARTV